ncbi:hypothetical protein FOZ61_004960 [Perkinsus olseni]|uniref:Uncharacterized protein n=1 Tax=Perkinsus olseni TaxID=32597 RepID=A0A7J6MC68_PEROL|nr:hypothetical protein FOZ61_004960 [Perkinsus olseni]
MYDTITGRECYAEGWTAKESGDPYPPGDMFGDEGAARYWLNFSFFYTRPFFRYFDSQEDLKGKLQTFTLSEAKENSRRIRHYQFRMSEESRRILEYQPNTALPQLSVQRRCCDGGQPSLGEPARPTGLPKPSHLSSGEALPSLSVPVLASEEIAAKPESLSTPSSMKAMEFPSFNTPQSAVSKYCGISFTEQPSLHPTRGQEATEGGDERPLSAASLSVMVEVAASTVGMVEPRNSGRPSSARRAPSPCPPVCDVPRLGSAPHRKVAVSDRRLPHRRSNVSDSGLPRVVVEAPSSSPCPSLRLSALPPLTPPRSRGIGRKRRRESIEDSSRVRDDSRASTVLPPSPRECKKDEDDENEGEGDGVKSPDSVTPRVTKRRMVKSEAGEESGNEQEEETSGKGLLGSMAREAKVEIGACVQCTALRPPRPRHHSLLRGAVEDRMVVAVGTMSMDRANAVEVMEYDPSTEQLVRSESIEHPFPVGRILWAPGNAVKQESEDFISCSDQLRLWRREGHRGLSFKLAGIFRPGPGCSGGGAPCSPYSGVAWSGARLAACTRSGLLMVWSTTTYDILRCSDFGNDTSNPMSLCDVAFVAPDVLAVCNTRGEVLLVDLAEEDADDAAVVVQRPPEEFSEQMTCFMAASGHGCLGVVMQETGEVVCYRFEMKGEEGKLRYLAIIYTESSVAAATLASSEGSTGPVLCTANDNGTLSLWKWPEEARGGPFPAARMRPLYQWSLSLSNKEGLISSLQLCSNEHLAPPSGCGQALVVSTTGGRVILTFLPEDLPTTWDDHEQPRQPSKAPRLSTTSTANGRTRLSAASRVSETGRAILVAAAPPPPRAEDYPSWTAISLTWLALFALGFGFAYLLLWYRQRKHEKVLERRQKILEKQRLKRASLNALLAADGGKETALRRERKTKIGRTRRDDGGDRSPEKAPREVVPRRHEHHRRKVKERTRPRVPPSQSPSAASPEERGTAGRPLLVQALMLLARPVPS